MLQNSGLKYEVFFAVGGSSFHEKHNAFRG